MKTRVLIVALTAMWAFGCGGQEESGERAPSAPNSTPEQSQQTKTSGVKKGTVSQNDIVMDVKDAFVVCDEADNVLTVYLFPSLLSDDERAGMRERDPFFVIAGKETPDAAKWESYPYAEIELRFTKDKPQTIENIVIASVVSIGITAKNSTGTTTMTSDFESNFSSLSVAGSESLQMKSKGVGVGGKITWDVELESQPIGK